MTNPTDPTPELKPQTPRTDELWRKYDCTVNSAEIVFDLAREIETDLALSEAGAAAMREALQAAEKQLAIVRRYLPTHGTFGEEGINAFEGAQAKVSATLATIAGESLLNEIQSLRCDSHALGQLIDALAKANPDHKGCPAPTDWAMSAVQHMVAERDTALAKVKELEGQSAWRPIESAPKDGSFLVALTTDDGYEIGIAKLTSNGAVQSVDDCEPYFCRPYYCEATHWQPLPPPPAAADSQNQPTINNKNT